MTTSVPLIGVTGSTGQLGGRVAARLATLGQPQRLLVRNLARAPQLPGAEVVQAGTTLRLETRAQAVAWNAALPCSGKIVSIKTKGDLTTATFLLGDRPERKCDGPGQHATAVSRVHEGKIVLWHQTSAAPAPVGPAV